MYGRVVNKKARHNLCFSQKADFELGFTIIKKKFEKNFLISLKIQL